MSPLAFLYVGIGAAVGAWCRWVLSLLLNPLLTGLPHGTLAANWIGALLMGVINNGLDLLNVSSYYQAIVKGVIIVAAVWLDRRKGRA